MLSPPCASQRFLLSRLHFFSHFARTPERASSHAGQNIRILCHDGYCTRTKGNTQSEALRSAHCTRGGIKPSTAPRRPAGAQVRRRDPLRRSLRRGLPLRTLWARCTLAALLLLWTRGGAATAVPAARRGWAHLRCPLGRPGRHGQDARRALQRIYAGARCAMQRCAKQRCPPRAARWALRVSVGASSRKREGERVRARERRARARRERGGERARDRAGARARERASDRDRDR